MSRRGFVSLGLCVLWLIVATQIVPPLIVRAYNGESLSVFNALIVSRSEHPLSEYLQYWRNVMWLGVIWCLGFWLALPLRRLVSSDRFFERAVGACTRRAGRDSLVDVRHPARHDGVGRPREHGHAAAQHGAAERNPPPPSRRAHRFRALSRKRAGVVGIRVFHHPRVASGHRRARYAPGRPARRRVLSDGGGDLQGIRLVLSHRSHSHLRAGRVVVHAMRRRLVDRSHHPHRARNALVQCRAPAIRLVEVRRLDGDCGAVCRRRLEQAVPTAASGGSTPTT